MNGGVSVRLQPAPVADRPQAGTEPKGRRCERSIRKLVRGAALDPRGPLLL